LLRYTRVKIRDIVQYQLLDRTFDQYDMAEGEFLYVAARV
jgi:hypothetical protein